MHPVSIIIPTLNEEKYLPLLLNSLIEVRGSRDIIVVDGNSKDGTKRVVEQCMPAFTQDSSLRYVQANTRGIAFQRNMGAAIAKHDVLMFCDADIVFTSPEAYQKLISDFVAKKYVAAAPVMIPLESGLNFRMVFGSAYYMQKLLLIFKRPYFAGACILTTKETFKRINGFDTTILLGEDVDYSLRASKVGACGLLPVTVKVSARRIIKYGYWWLVRELPNIMQFAFTGKITKPERIAYPFGDFGDLIKKK